MQMICTLARSFHRAERQETMSQPPRRRSAPQKQPGAFNPAERVSKGKKSRSRATITLSLIVFLAVLALIVLVSPKEHLGRAYYSAGTDSGLADQNGDDQAAYYRGLVISEIMPSNRTSVPDENGEYSDWIEIWNHSDHDIDLANVGLSDSSDAIKFLFPQVTLKAGERAVVFCSGTNVAEAGKTWHAKFKLSSNGETIYLYQPSAYLIDSVSYRIMGSDTSWAMMPDGSFE